VTEGPQLQLLPQPQTALFGATSIAGVRLKNPIGFNVKPNLSTGITGQSSIRGM
jgi:hypothetical protein